jgi:asparagine synthase (glutamine-hydrolysing)
MASRGPDGKGEWYSSDGRVALGHRRLSIIDLSERAAQPMSTPDGTLVITYNGEIYNYKKLRRELEQKGVIFQSESDTEVLLHLYAEKGVRMLQDLRGMFAFTIWDEEKKELLLARDPFGIKPLYYANDGRTFHAASQVKALLTVRTINRSPEPAGHVGFFLWGHIPEPYTLYKSIRSIPTGTYVVLGKNGEKERQTFFSISKEMVECNVKTMKPRGNDSSSSLREALIDSVRHHLVSDVPVGVFLSSGLDSTTLTALAAEMTSGDLRTITLGFNEFHGTENDEAPLAEQVAEHYGTLHQTKWVSKGEFHAELGHLLDVMDQPSIDGVNTYFVSKVAAETGLTTAISGLGGDELFGGYPSFRDIPLSIRATKAFRHMPRIGKAFRWVSAPLLKQFTSPKYAGLLEYGANHAGAYLLRRGLFMPWELPDVLDGEIVREGWRELRPLSRLEETVLGIGTDHLKVSTLEMTWYMRNQLLRDADWAGMAHSLEIRVPLVDVSLVRVVAPLLANDNPLSKRDMALTPVKSLPDRVLSRNKTGFSIPIRQWLIQGDRTARSGRGLRGWAQRVYQSFITG